MNGGKSEADSVTVISDKGDVNVNATSESMSWCSKLGIGIGDLLLLGSYTAAITCGVLYGQEKDNVSPWLTRKKFF